MIGNVGRDAGTLVFNGKFETADLITGEVEFSRSFAGTGRRDTAHSERCAQEDKRKRRLKESIGN